MRSWLPEAEMDRPNQRGAEIERIGKDLRNFFGELVDHWCGGSVVSGPWFADGWSFRADPPRGGSPRLHGRRCETLRAGFDRIRSGNHPLRETFHGV